MPRRQRLEEQYRREDRLHVRSVGFFFRLKPAEMDQVEAKAHQMGVKTVDMVRSLALDYPLPPYRPSPPPSSAVEAATWLRAEVTQHHLNTRQQLAQLASKVQAAGATAEDIRGLLRKIEANLDAERDLLLQIQKDNASTAEGVDDDQASMANVRHTLRRLHTHITRVPPSVLLATGGPATASSGSPTPSGPQAPRSEIPVHGKDPEINSSRQTPSGLPPRPSPPGAPS